jgi:hypothetical protein
MATKFLANLNLSQNELQNARIQNLTTTQINAISTPVEGQIVYDTTADVMKYYNGSAWVVLSITSGTVTTVTASTPLASTGGTTPDISIADGTTSAKGAVQLEDSYTSTSTTKAATPAAVKAAYDLANGKANPGDTTYVGTTAVALNRTSANQALTGISSVQLPGSTSGNVTVQATATAGSNTITFPAATGTVALTSDLSGFLTAAVTSIAGTENEVDVSASTGSVTVGLPQDVTISRHLTVTGDLTVNGNTTTLNTSTLEVEDKNVVLAKVATPTDTTADGAGITVKGATDKTLNWVDATDSWTSSEDFDLLSGGVYRVAGTEVLSASALGSGVTGSSLTSVGTITSGTWNGTDIAVADGGTGASDAAGAKTNLGFMTRYATTATWTAGENKTVTHSLGTKDVIVNVYDSNDAMVIADVVTTTTSAITVMCSVAGNYRVVVIG